MFSFILIFLVVTCILVFYYEAPKWKVISALFTIVVLFISQQLIYIGMDIEDKIPTQISKSELGNIWIALFSVILIYLVCRLYSVVKSTNNKY
jgi:hypothetical protein